MEGRLAKAYVTRSMLGRPAVRWNPGDRLRARASRSVPEWGAPRTNTGWRTLVPLITRMCEVDLIVVTKCRTPEHLDVTCRTLRPQPGRTVNRRRRSCAVPSVEPARSGRHR